MPTQSQYGKAFEYALIDEANNILASQVVVRVIQDATYNVALAAFNLFSAASQTRYRRAADAAINHIIQLEPRLNNSSSPTDTIELQLMPDSAGQQGDVRDVLFIRSSQQWEIGISAKNNHKAVKHNRLSDTIDFGQDWLGVPCSANYFNTIAPVFAQLRTLKSTNATWASVSNKENLFIYLFSMLLELSC